MKAMPELDLDLAAIAESWRYGSVVRSWLLDFAANALPTKKASKKYAVTSKTRVKVDGQSKKQSTLRFRFPSITASLFARFASRQDESFAAASTQHLRNQFGGHAVNRTGRRYTTVANRRKKPMPEMTPEKFLESQAEILNPLLEGSTAAVKRRRAYLWCSVRRVT